MKKRILDIAFAIIVGFISCYAYFSIFGIVVSSGIEESLIKWISTLQKSNMFFGLIINEVILQTASSLPSIAVIGLILGVLTGNKPIINGAIAFVVFILRFIYLESYKYEFFEHSIPFYAPMWSFMIDVLIWFGFFVIFTVIGHKFKKLLQRMHSQPFASRERKNRAT